MHLLIHSLSLPSSFLLDFFRSSFPAPLRRRPTRAARPARCALPVQYHPLLPLLTAFLEHPISNPNIRQQPMRIKLKFWMISAIEKLEEAHCQSAFARLFDSTGEDGRRNAARNTVGVSKKEIGWKGEGRGESLHLANFQGFEDRSVGVYRNRQM